jgi:hypothetical protein
MCLCISVGPPQTQFYFYFFSAILYTKTTNKSFEVGFAGEGGSTSPSPGGVSP